MCKIWLIFQIFIYFFIKKFHLCKNQHIARWHYGKNVEELLQQRQLQTRGQCDCSQWRYREILLSELLHFCCKFELLNFVDFALCRNAWCNWVGSIRLRKFKTGYWSVVLFGSIPTRRSQKSSNKIKNLQLQSQGEAIPSITATLYILWRGNTEGHSYSIRMIKPLSIQSINQIPHFAGLCIISMPLPIYSVTLNQRIVNALNRLDPVLSFERLQTKYQSESSLKAQTQVIDTIESISQSTTAFCQVSGVTLTQMTEPQIKNMAVAHIIQASLAVQEGQPIQCQERNLQQAPMLSMNYQSTIPGALTINGDQANVIKDCCPSQAITQKSKEAGIRDSNSHNTRKELADFIRRLGESDSNYKWSQPETQRSTD